MNVIIAYGRVARFYWANIPLVPSGTFAYFRFPEDSLYTAVHSVYLTYYQLPAGT